MIESIASAAVDMNAAQISMDYSIAVTKKVMDAQELAGQELMRMLPPPETLGQYIDTYA